MRRQPTIPAALNTLSKPRRSAAKSRVGRAPRTPHTSPHRRGNTLVLVAGILVLLVIIATSYLTTTQTQRGTSIAQQASSQRDDNSELIAEKIAAEIRDALFVWPIDVDDPGLGDFFSGFGFFNVADANFPRKHPAPDAARYGVDRQFIFGEWVTFGYNFAPYHTVPFTNLPDQGYVINPEFWPAGPGNRYLNITTGAQAGEGGGNPAIAALLSAESNPMGNPGFGDNRWLRDTEPVRYDSNNNGIADAFSHWRKLSYLPRANNGWRAVADISDVDRWIVTDLNIPVEQWPAITSLGAGAQNIGNPPNATANSSFLTINGPGNQNRFIRQWRNWFGFDDGNDPDLDGIGNYEAAYTNNNQLGSIQTIPANFFNLRSLRGLNERHNYPPLAGTNNVNQDAPDAEFIPGTARHTVGRVLTDTTGDGFTDSFWFLAPTPVRGGIRQVVAVSIVDNSARINANVATRFHFDDPSNNDRRKTRGQTPADIALAGQLTLNGGNNTWNVGFYDNADHWAIPMAAQGVDYYIRYHPDRWNRHKEEIGLPDTLWMSEEDRLDYWQYAGRLGTSFNPETMASPSGNIYRPFTLSDELELRMFEGNNNPWVFSRLEYTTQRDAVMMANPASTVGFLRPSPLSNQESSEYMDQLNNRELVRDSRRKMTVYSGARNDQTSPGLWWFNRYSIEPTSIQALASSAPPPGYTAAQWRSRVYRNFEWQSRNKLDLRDPDYWLYDENGLYHDVSNGGRLGLRERLAPMLLMALTDSPDELIDGVPYTSYYGRYALADIPNTSGGTLALAYDSAGGPLNRTRRLAAAYAANILAYRSNQPVSVADAIPLPAFGVPPLADQDPGHPNPVDEANYIAEGALPGVAGTVSYLGLDPQPFLVEVFVAHIYKPSATVPPLHVPEIQGIECEDLEFIDPEQWGDFDIVPYANAGSRMIIDTPDSRSSLVVVQIANPFDVPIDLYEYQLEVFGESGPQVFNLNTLPLEKQFLQPATDANPVTAIFYAIRDNLDGDTPGSLHEKWTDFLDITATGAGGFPSFPTDKLPAGTIVHRVDLDWSTTSREAYDNYESGDRPGVALRRSDPSVASGVVLDRMDFRDHSTNIDAVRNMGRYRPILPDLDNLCYTPPDNDDNFPAYTVPNDEHHWVQWVRVTRAWGVDVNGNGFYENHERNPRYVFSDHALVVPTRRNTAEVSGSTGYTEPRIITDGYEPDIDSNVAGGIVYRFADDPNGTDPSNPVPWFATKYYRADGELMWEDPALTTNLLPARKPTFFDMNFQRDPASNNGNSNIRSYPDKGWYGQFDAYSYTAGALQPITRVGGIEAPTVLTLTTREMENGNSIGWTGRRVPLFRHPFSMQMTQKNKIIPDDYTLSGWSAAAVDELRRNRDFEQIGEVLNVWLFGHEIVNSGGTVTTRITFSEFMGEDQARLTGLRTNFPQLDPLDLDSDYENWLRSGHMRSVNRLLTQPVVVVGGTAPIGQVLNQPLLLTDPTSATYEEDVARYRSDVRHAWPAIPAGARVLDLFVCDGPGRWPYVEAYTALPPLTPLSFIDERRFYNGNGFTGELTPGLININTATPEVLRALPHMTRIVSESYPFQENPFPRVVEAITRYRDRIGAPAFTHLPSNYWDAGPAYAHRGRTQDFFAGPPSSPDTPNSKFIPGMRGSRGFASIGELALLTQSGRFQKNFVSGTTDLFEYANLNSSDGFNTVDDNSSWRIDYATMPDRREYWRDYPAKFEPGSPENPYAYLFRTGSLPNYAPNNVNFAPLSTRISTDTVDYFDENFTQNGYPLGMQPDWIAEDMEEANVLLAGMSNLVTTRSDTFTVHFRVRSFRQNPVTGIWDATDPEYIVDDSRYVMLVDRSNVNKPSDKPRILYLEKLPK